MLDMANIFGISSAIISLVGACYYALAIKSGKIRPFRATWIIWMILGMIIVGSYKASGASEGMYKPVADVIGYALILLVLRNGRAKGGWSFYDYLCLTFAGIGLFLWATTNDPRKALYITLIIDFTGWLPIFAKTLVKPDSESLVSWFLWALNSALNIVAVYLAGDYRPEIIIYPLYMFVGNMMIFTIIAVFKLRMRSLLTQEG